jgi:thiol-disulfide isomerase/thioredoxin
MILYHHKLGVTGLGKYWAVMAIPVLLAVGIAACSPEVSEPAADSVYDFPIVFYQGQDAVGGENLELSDLRGQPIVLNFWAGLCPPCRAEMPEFQHFADDYAGRALVVGVDLGQFFSLGSQEDAMKLLNELEVKYPAGYTADANVVRELGVLGLPATFFVNADGSLHRKWQGVLNTEKLTEITDEMLAQ